MRATQLLALYGEDMAISEDQAAGEVVEFDAHEYERMSGALGCVSTKRLSVYSSSVVA